MANHSITGYQFSILLEKSERASIWGNTIVGTTKWQTGELKNVIGVLLVNGKNARMENNDISSGVFGVFASDRGGRLEQNELHSNFIGLILCKVPAQIPLRPGEILSSQISAREWKVRFNSAFGNFNDGYLVIDGANRNILENNDASNNGAYDIELCRRIRTFWLHDTGIVSQHGGCGALR